MRKWTFLFGEGSDLYPYKSGYFFARLVRDSIHQKNSLHKQAALVLKSLGRVIHNLLDLIRIDLDKRYETIQ